MTPINEIMIIGDGMSDSVLNEFANREGVLCIGDGKSSVTLELINEKLQEVIFADNLRIDIDAHGWRNEQKQHSMALESGFTTFSTEDFLKGMKNLLTKQSGKQDLAAEWHLWSCYGGSSNKVAHILGKNNSLITHVDSKNDSITDLMNYTADKSIKNYLENFEKDSYTRWTQEQKYSFETSTFNFNPTSDKEDAIHLKTARILKPEILEDILKKFKHTNDLTVIFTDFIAEDIRKIESSEEFKKLGYFKNNFKESDETKIELSSEEAKNLALGMAIYLCNKIKNQYIDILKQYLRDIKQHGVDLDNSDVFGFTLLISAAEKGDTEVVNVLLEAGVDIDKADSRKVYTPLIVAAEKGNKEVVEVLLAAGADVDKASDSQGCTPLIFAANEGHIEIVNVLLEAGADVDKAVDVDKAIIPLGYTPLLVAAHEGYTEVVKVLLEAGADVNKGDAQNTTPLCIAAQMGHIEVVAELLKYGANTDLKGIEYLKNANIDMDTPAKDGSTLLLRAIDQTGIVEALLEAGADSSKALKDGTTPLQAAMSTKNKDIIKLITKSVLKDQSITNTPTVVPSTPSKSNSKAMGI